MPKLIFARDFEKDAYRILELGQEAIAHAIESHEPLVIKGLPDDEAVMCTKNQTFVLREVHTSNSLVLTTIKDGDCVIEGDVSSTIEAIPCLAKLGRIDTLLASAPYAGPTKSNEGEQKYTFQDLLSLVQASEQELKEGLAARHVFEYQGYLRIFDPTYLHRLLDALITNATLADMDFNNMPWKEAWRCMSLEEEGEAEIPEPVARACLSAFGTWHGENVKLEEDKVCSFLGEVILRESGDKQWALPEFMEVWQKLARDMFTPSLSMLRGLYVLTERRGQRTTQTYIEYLPLRQLPTDPARRFARLFQQKKQWTAEEIEPFLSDLAPSAKERDTLLLKYARMQRRDGQVYYSTRIK